jgi:tRNA(adenine34) deaminase
MIYRVSHRQLLSGNNVPMFSERDLYWMHSALDLAKIAANRQEVPVGAVLVFEDRLIGEGFNSPISSCDPTAHAEIIAIRQGALACHNYRLMNSTLYVTLEPCIMCMGAIAQARIQRVIFGAADIKGGEMMKVSRGDIAQSFNHRVAYQGGLLAEQCGKVLTDFFELRR